MKLHLFKAKVYIKLAWLLSRLEYALKLSAIKLNYWLHCLAIRADCRYKVCIARADYHCKVVAIRMNQSKKTP